MYPNTFYRVSVKALITNKKGEILVVKENQDTWSLPGGGLDHGEDPQAGVLRELKEELGVKNAHIKDIATTRTFYLERKSAWLLWVVYAVELPEDGFALGEGVTEVRYMNVSELHKSEDVFEKLVYSIASERGLA